MATADGRVLEQVINKALHLAKSETGGLDCNSFNFDFIFVASELERHTLRHTAPGGGSQWLHRIRHGGDEPQTQVFARVLEFLKIF